MRMYLLCFLYSRFDVISFTIIGCASCIVCRTSSLRLQIKSNIIFSVQIKYIMLDESPGGGQQNSEHTLLRIYRHVHIFVQILPLLRVSYTFVCCFGTSITVIKLTAELCSFVTHVDRQDTKAPRCRYISGGRWKRQHVLHQSIFCYARIRYALISIE